MKLLKNFLLLFVVISQICLTLQESRFDSKNFQHQVSPQSQNALTRDKRFFFKKKKPGIFGTIFGLIIDQYRDTKSTINKVTGTINAQFADENEVTAKPQKQLDENATTTEAPYKLTRSELYRIIRRNVKGLQRLFQIELQDALSQPKPNYLKDIKGNANRNSKS